MNTIKVFRSPHKALRKIMSEFLVLTGQTDFTNPSAIKKLQTIGSEMFLLLKAHAHTEDLEILDVLEHKIPGSSHHDAQDHLKIEKIQDELEKDFMQLNEQPSAESFHAFYLKMASFFGLYLEHIEEEEMVTQKLIWEKLSFDEQMLIQQCIVKNLDPTIYRLWLKHIIPAQNEPENVMMLGVIRQHLAEEGYRALLSMLEETMDKTTFQSLEQQLLKAVVD